MRIVGFSAAASGAASTITLSERIGALGILQPCAANSHLLYSTTEAPSEVEQREKWSRDFRRTHVCRAPHFQVGISNRE